MQKDPFEFDSGKVRRTETCPDCIFRDDVDLLGRPRRGRHWRIRSCMGCGGTARVPRSKYIVPWWLARR